MVLAKYIRREIFSTCALVTVVLAVILLGGRLMMYLGYAAEGQITPSLVFLLVLYRSPEFMQMILPLGFFMGILLTLGRMSVERELAVIEGAGISLLWILRQLSGVTLILMFAVACLSLYFGPLGVQQTDITFEQQAQRADFKTLAPGRFHPMRSGTGVTYVDKLGDAGHEMRGIFVAEMSEISPDDEMNTALAIVLARSGKRQVFSSVGEEFLQLREGKRYELQPGKPVVTVIEFQGYRAKIVDRAFDSQNIRIKGMSTLHLLQDTSNKALGELHWRLGLPMLAPNVLLLALALCRINPRQGRFLRLFPAIGLYLLYLAFAMVLKAQIEKKGITLVPFFWGLHITIFAVGVLGLLKADGRLRKHSTSLTRFNRNKQRSAA